MQWSKKEMSGRLYDMIMKEKDRKKAEGEPFEAPGSAGLKPPFANVH